MKPLLLAPALALCLSGCAPLLGMMAGAGTPPQAPASVTAPTRTGIDFALNSFDAVLYGLDFAMDAKRIIPGSPTAKKLAVLGRKVMGSLEVADSALKLGHEGTYEQAFSDAKQALEEFRSLFQSPASATVRPPLTNAQRMAILDRLDRATPTIV